jgi:secreted trypsin-like serine protease
MGVDFNKIFSHHDKKMFSLSVPEEENVMNNSMCMDVDKNVFVNKNSGRVECAVISFGSEPCCAMAPN